MSNYIVTTRHNHFKKLGFNTFCTLEEMTLPHLLACDTETTGLKPALGADMFSVQLGTGENNYLIDMTEKSKIVFEDVIPYLKGKSLVFQNASFDLGFFYKHNYYHKEVHDTFIASKLLYNGYPPNYRHGFAFVMERELGLDYDKSSQKNIHKVQLDTKKAIDYCFNDVDKLLELLMALGKKLRTHDMIGTYELHRKYIRALAYMEQCGVPINSDTLNDKIKNDKVILQEKQLVVNDYVFDNLPKFRTAQGSLFDMGKELNVKLGSPLQMIPVFNGFGINTTDDSVYPTKESTAETIINKSDHEFVDIWLDFQSAKHDVTTFGQGILDKVVDGRIYSSYNPILDTARISTRKGDVNTLNLPANKKTRSIVEAKEGYKMVGADYAGQENSVGIFYHEDPMMMKAVLEGKDLHSAFARTLFPDISECTDEEVKTLHSDKRSYAKAPRFLFNYGGGWYTLSKNNNIPEKRAKEIEEAYRQLHWGIYEWGDKELEKALKKGYIQHAGGFRIKLPFFSDYLRIKAELSENFDLWNRYGIGKKEYLKEEIAKEAEEIYDIVDEANYDFYLEVKPSVSRLAKLKSTYYKLCLNNPIQGTAAHQTKRAAVLLFEEIEKNNHYGAVKICIIPHDEFLLEVRDDLVEQYSTVLENSMIDGGNYYIKGANFSMESDAEVGKTWWDCH